MQVNNRKEYIRAKIPKIKTKNITYADKSLEAINFD